MTITEQSHRYLFRAFREIDYDNGMVNRLEPERTSYEIPISYTFRTAVANIDLRCLNAEQLHTFCCGEEAEMADIASTFGFAYTTHTLLDDYFDGWPYEQEEDLHEEHDENDAPF